MAFPDDTNQQTLDEEARSIVSGASAETDQEDDADEPEASEGTPNRDEKKRNRWRENVEARKAAEARTLDLERQLAEERGRQQAAGAIYEQQQRQAYAQQQGQWDQPFNDEEKRLLERMEMLRNTYAKLESAKITQEDANRYNNEYVQLDGYRQQVITQREIRRAQLMAMQQPGPNPGAQAAEMHIRMNYAEIADNPVALHYAQGELMRIQASRARMNGNRPVAVDMKMFDEALSATRKAFGGGGPGQKQQQNERAMFSGVASNGAGEPAAANGKQKLSRQTMTKADRSMARNMYPKETPEKAYDIWLRKAGNRPD
jgi:hypothetical protein